LRAFLAGLRHLKLSIPRLLTVQRLIPEFPMEEQNHLNKTAPKAVRLLTPDEASQFLGVSTKTLRRLVKNGEIPAVKVSKSMRFELAQLQAFVARSVWR
jgi:excisionase family DNA binding protein